MAGPIKGGRGPIRGGRGPIRGGRGPIGNPAGSRKPTKAQQEVLNAQQRTFLQAQGRPVNSHWQGVPLKWYGPVNPGPPPPAPFGGATADQLAAQWAADHPQGATQTMGGGSYPGTAAGPDPMAGLNTSFAAQSGQIGQIGSDVAARLKAIQDQYQQAVQQIQGNTQATTAQLAANQAAAAGASNADLAAQGFSNAPVQQANQIATQGLADQQNRQAQYLAQLQQAQLGNFADRQAAQAQATGGAQQALAAQMAQAQMSGGGSSGGGSGGGRRGGGGGSSSSSSGAIDPTTGLPGTDIGYARALSIGRTLLSGQDAGNQGADFLAANRFNRRTNPKLANARRALLKGEGSAALYATIPKKYGRTRAFVRQYTQAQGKQKHFTAQDFLNAYQNRYG